MSAITIDDDLVHYEVLGRGRPVILVHDWLSSWRYWVPTMQQLSMKYRTYALDLWGFGDSGKGAEGRYTLDAHVKLLGDFMDKLGITKAALVGHSLGAAVAIRFVMQNPDRIPRLMTISAPLFEMAQSTDGSPRVASGDEHRSAGVAAPATGPVANVPPAPPAADQAAGPANDSPQAPPPSPPGLPEGGPEARSESGRKFEGPEMLVKPGEPIPELEDLTPPPMMEVTTREVSLPPNPLRDQFRSHKPLQMLEKYLGKDSPEFEKMAAEVGKAEETAFAVSAFSFDQVNLAYDVRRLTGPTLLVHGEKNDFLPPPSQKLIDYLSYGKANFRCVIWPTTRHFPMLDDPTTFHRLVMDFLDTPDLSQLEFKERWSRKVR